MTKVLLDAALRSRLHDLSEPMEFCDEGGRMIGCFFPAPEILLGDRAEPPPLSQQEIDRLEKEPDYSTAEVFAYLEKL